MSAAVHAGDRLARDADAGEHRLRREIGAIGLAVGRLDRRMVDEPRQRRPAARSPFAGGAHSICVDRRRRRARSASANDASPTLSTRGPSWNSFVIRGSPTCRIEAFRPARLCDDARREPDRLGVALGEDHAGLAQCRFLCGKDCGSPAVPQTKPTNATAAVPARASLALASASTGAISARRVGVCAVAEHDVEQDHRRLRVARLLRDALVAQGDGRSSDADGRG